MAYTEFRKSYGDFEIVIPAIDFSKLNNDEAHEGSRSFVFEAEDVRDATNIGNVFAALSAATYGADSSTNSQ